MASSADVREDDIPPVGSSHAVPQSLDSPPATSPPEARAQENVDTVVSPHGRSIFKKWFQRKGKQGPASHKPDRRSKPGKPADRRSPAHPPTRADDNHEGPSWMAAAQPTPVSAIP